jgi:hypothetical protein
MESFQFTTSDLEKIDKLREESGRTRQQYLRWLIMRETAAALFLPEVNRDSALATAAEFARLQGRTYRKPTVDWSVVRRILKHRASGNKLIDQDDKLLSQVAEWYPDTFQKLTLEVSPSP